MNRIDTIIDQIQRAHEGPAWFGPSVREALQNVTSEQASHRPNPKSHSIWEVVLHMTAWRTFTLRWLDQPSEEVTPEMDWPRIASTSDDGWQTSLQELHDSARLLCERVALLSDGDLERIVEGRDYTVEVLLLGLPQHDAYHTGQIMLLKKHLPETRG